MKNNTNYVYILNETSYTYYSFRFKNYVHNILRIYTYLANTICIQKS
jgi:hypothetical protein